MLAPKIKPIKERSVGSVSNLSFHKYPNAHLEC